jgi:anti-anti-sigma factor
LYETLIELAESNGVRVIKVGNEVDIANADTLQRYLEEAADGNDTFVVSLENCRYIDSSGLRPIIQLAGRVGDAFFIVVPRGTQIRRIFDLTNLGERMNVCDSVAEAVSRANAYRRVAV